MFDVPVDAWYVWVALSLASVAVLGAAVSLPTAPPPDAATAAETVDRVAAAEVGAVAEHPLDADEVALGYRRLGLRNDAGTVHARFSFNVTPVADGSALQDVLYGTPPSRAFDSREAFVDAVVTARSRERTWQSADRTLVVRRVSWRDYDVTLVDA